MRDVFDDVVCGIDGSAQAFEALRQVECLRPDTGELHLTSVAEVSMAVHGGFAARASTTVRDGRGERARPRRRALGGSRLEVGRG
jgi:hypothetical protein